eukprot:CAMPEP_0119013368 /NCGR_PEP_ID=MMETSP1176-20130426/8413_1 /TAXON_ID=265551 /ORGANISM="Synedropsis recta cf, Strain CCMP1620" /LENGTH=149 /DNA_ID=CAMNT_0006966457 /DNA_START=98 /DNA_END=544 /DNA_ORIENTATION=-
MAAAPYRRVSQGEDGGSSRPRSERFMDKIYAVIWITLALLVAKWTRFIPILTSDNRIVKPLLYSALVCLGINTVLLFYLCIYLPRIKGITDSSAWDVYCPRVVPTMATLGVLCALMLIRACWPVWGFLAPLILGVEAFGCLFALHFVPW